MSDAKADWRDATEEELAAAAVRKVELRRQLAELQRIERAPDVPRCAMETALGRQCSRRAAWLHKSTGEFMCGHHARECHTADTRPILPEDRA